MVSNGPGGYTPAMKQNLGMDVRNYGYQGGQRPTSGMASTQGRGPFGYKPVEAKSDPLQPLLSALAPPAAPKTTYSSFSEFPWREYIAANPSLKQGGNVTAEAEGKRAWEHYLSKGSNTAPKPKPQAQTSPKNGASSNALLSLLLGGRPSSQQGSKNPLAALFGGR